MTHTRTTLFSPSLALAVSIAAFVPVILFDTPIFTAANSCHSPLTDQVWRAVTSLGDGLVLGIIVGAFIVVNPRVVAIGIPLLLLSSLTVNLIKAGFPSLRPAELLGAVHVVGPLLRSGSFPSGHAAAAMAAGLSIASYCSFRPGRAIAVSMALLTGVSRIFVGAHFPKDVLAGIVCALVLFLIVRALFQTSIEARIPDRPPFRGRLFWAAFWLEVGAALFTIFVYGPYYSEFPAVPMVVAVVVLTCLAIGYKVAAKEAPAGFTVGQASSLSNGK
jgi:membrane-associated phospholipid phosphatase